MTKAPRTASKLLQFLRPTRWAVSEILALISVISAYQGHYWLALGSLCLLATQSVLPRSNPIYYWPVGLACVVMTTYIGAWILWFESGAGKGGVGENFSEKSFLLQSIAFYLITKFRLTAVQPNHEDEDLTRTWQQVIVSLPSLAMVGYSVFQLARRPFILMGGYFGGGDHMNHANLVYELSIWTAGNGLKSPLDIYAVPDGLHFLISNLVGLGSSQDSMSPLAQVFKAAAWFEWVQASAFVQLAVVLVVGTSKRYWWFKFSVAVSAMVATATVDLLVLQFMWSGFTTTLGICWLLLIPLVISRTQSQSFGVSSIVLGLISLAYLSWIIYQPYSVILVLLVVAIVLRSTLLKTLRRSFVSSSFFAVFGLLLIFGGSLTIGLILFGTKNDFVQRLLYSGATYEPYFYTVIFWVCTSFVSALLLIKYNKAENKRRRIFESNYYLLVVLLTSTAIGLVISTSDFGLTNQPYYTQKMLWTALFISLPVAISNCLELLEVPLSKWSATKRLAFMFSVPLLTLLAPLMTQKYPVLASEHTLHEWIGRSIAQPTGLNPAGEVAFSSNDPQGTYIANLALRSTSQNEIDTSLSLSDNPYAVCLVINRQPTTTVFTRVGGKKYLVNAGCSPDFLYIESGERIEAEKSTYKRIDSNQVITVISKPSLDEIVSNGFVGDEGYIRWATGLNSFLRFSLPDEINGVVALRLGYVITDSPRGINQVTISVNGSPTVSNSFYSGEVGEVVFSLEQSLPVKNIEIEVSCDWTEEEVNRDFSATKPPLCFGITSVEVFNESVSLLQP